MSHRIGIISNPYARLVRKNPNANRELQSLLSGKGLFSVTRTPEEVAETLHNFKKQGVGCVGIVGGDGSINLILTELLKLHSPESLPNILVLGGGTANVLALNLGLNHSPTKVMSDFLDVNGTAPNRLTPISIPSLQVDGRTGFLFANGVAARFLDLFYQNKGSTTDAAFLLARAALQNAVANPKIQSAEAQQLASLAKATPMALAASPKIEEWAQKNPRLSCVFVSTLKFMGFGVPLFHQLDGIRAELFATSLENQALVWQLTRAFFHRPLQHPSIIHDLVSDVKVTTSPHDRYTIDGELFDAQKESVMIKTGQKFTFHTPYGESNGAQTALHHRRHWLERLGAGALRRRNYPLP
jgi:hypothetical protein